MSIDPAARRGFGLAPDVYERARPDYPQAAVTWLVAKMRLAPTMTVLDVGAGTGKLTRALVGVGAKAIAIEPIPEMRDTLRELVREAQVLAGTAEAIPLADASVDCVTAGSAFHWFRFDDALAEFHRVLRAGGSLGLVWNERDVEQPLQRALNAIVHRTERHAKPEEWQAALAVTPLFTDPERRQFRWAETWDAERFVAFASTLSEIASLPARPREAALAEVRSLTAALPARFAVRFRTDAYVCCRR